MKLLGVDSVEYAVKSIQTVEPLLKIWGFEKTGSGKTGNSRCALWGQGKIKFLITQGDTLDSEASIFVKKHGDGICNVSFLVEDAAHAAEFVGGRGAEITHQPKTVTAGPGKIKTSSMAAMGDVIHTFISRHGTSKFSDTVDVDIEKSPKGLGMFATDHLTCNLASGQLDKWSAFYEKVLDFKVTRSFHITTGRTGLLSKVMENTEGTVKIPLNEPADKKSQIQEYIDTNRGPGVQHLALATGNILDTLPKLRKGGQKFLSVPDTYYDEVPKRVKTIKENLGELKSQGILVDGDNSGYLLQIFSENVVGPFFFEVIQRCGNKGFGEGNFKALFEAIERDQERRGVI